MNKQDIVKLLETNDKAVARALVVLNKRQTLDEQTQETTKHRNGVGFTPADARVGTSMAEFYQRAKFLTPRQVAYWRKPNRRGVMRIAKYAGQLLEVAQTKSRATHQQAIQERIEEKTEFACQEALAEQNAFRAKMSREDELT